MRFRGSRGLVAVELAIVAPLLILFLIGSAQVGLVVVGNAVGSNAAREGARVASIRFECADRYPGSGKPLTARCSANPSTDYNVIKAAVMDKLVGLVKTSTVTVTVACRDGSSTGPVIACDKGVAIPDEDIVEVVVGWHHIGGTPFVNDGGHSATSRTVINGRPDLASLVPEPDPNPPQIVPAILALDVNVNGILDAVQMTFDEDIEQTASTSAFTIANSPTGSNVISSATVAGRIVTLQLTGTTVDTAPASMTVALAASTSGVRDLFGNPGSFAATTVTDAARPVLVGLTDTNGLINGRMGFTDTLALTFSEPIATTLGSTSVVESDPPTSANDSVDIAGITAGPQLTTSNNYVSTGSSSVSFAANLSKSGNNVVVTLSSLLCTSPVLCLNLGTGNESTPWAFTPATTLVDAAGNTAAGSRTIVNIF